jgi:hypothetical protein
MTLQPTIFSARCDCGWERMLRVEAMVDMAPSVRPAADTCFVRGVDRGLILGSTRGLMTQGLALACESML